MPRARDLLERFRPAGAPGGATAAGMPTDRVADAEAELAPVLAALAPTQSECAAIVATARAEAAALIARAKEQARSLDETTRQRLPAERAAAAARAVAADRELAASSAASVQEQLDHLLIHGRAVIPGLVADVVRTVRATIEGPSGVGGADEPVARVSP